jgi:hypothetical protein
MSVRANSLRIALFDGLYFAATAALAAFAVTSVVHAAEPQTVRTSDIATDRRLTDDHIDSQLNTDDNMPSGNPEESPQAKREAMMLGMKLVELHRGYIRIDDVAATSPAWDAGIRPGDRLISIDTLSPRSLAPWVQDIGKILKDTPDGKSVSAAVERDGEKLALRIRLPVSKAAEVRDARQEERALASMAAGNQQQQSLGQQGAMPMASGGDTNAVVTDGSGLGGWGIGGFFGDETGTSSGVNDDRMANSAVAELMAVNTLSGGPADQQRTNGFHNTQNMQSSGGQVGIAAFQNNGNGVNAVVVVRGLPQGTYQVGIGQGDAITGGGTNFGAGAAVDGAFSNGAGSQLGRGNQFGHNRNVGVGGRARGGGNFEGSSVPNNQRPGSQTTQRPGLQGSGAGTTPIQRPGVQQPPVGNPNGSTPIQRPSGGSIPTSSGGASGGDAAGGGASLANPHAAPILAQQFQQEPQQGMDTQNNNFRSAAPGTSNTNQSGARDTGLNPGEPPQVGNDFSSGDRNSIGAPGGMSPFVSEIGILRVGPDGSGRVENQIEGMEVRNLAGMSVSVVSAMSQGGGGFSETTADNPQTVGREMPQNGMSQNGMPQNGQFPQSNQGRGNPLADRNNPLGTQSGQSGGQGIVATGVIRLMEGGSAPGVGGEARRGLQQGEERPVDQATQQQRNRSQITNPQQDFDPSRSQ